MKISPTFRSVSSASSEQRSERKDTLVLIAAGFICSVPILALTASAFIVVPDNELPGDATECLVAVPGSQDSDDGTASEMWVLVQAFTLGWACCLAMKLLHKHGAFVYVSCSAAFSFSVERMWAYAAAKKDTLLIVGAGIVVMVPIFALIVSAFAATVEGEAGDDGLASEGSLAMRAFTIGWIVCLAIKLYRELVGLVGFSSCMALLSC